MFGFPPNTRENPRANPRTRTHAHTVNTLRVNVVGVRETVLMFVSRVMFLLRNANTFYHYNGSNSTMLRTLRESHSAVFLLHMIGAVVCVEIR